VSKKFENSNYNGKQQYVKDKSSSAQDLIQRRLKLEQLERAFFQSLEDAEWVKQEGRITAQDVLATRHYGFAHPTDIPGASSPGSHRKLAPSLGVGSRNTTGEKWGDALAAASDDVVARTQQQRRQQQQQQQYPRGLDDFMGNRNTSLLGPTLLDRQIMSARLGTSGLLGAPTASSASASGNLFPTSRNLFSSGLRHLQDTGSAASGGLGFSSSLLDRHHSDLIGASRAMSAGLSSNAPPFMGGSSGALTNAYNSTNAAIEQELYLQELRQRHQLQHHQEQQLRGLTSSSSSSSGMGSLSQHQLRQLLGNPGSAGDSALSSLSTSSLMAAARENARLELEEMQIRQAFAASATLGSVNLPMSSSEEGKVDSPQNVRSRLFSSLASYSAANDMNKRPRYDS